MTPEAVQAQAAARARHLIGAGTHPTLRRLEVLVYAEMVGQLTEHLRRAFPPEPPDNALARSLAKVWVLAGWAVAVVAWGYVDPIVGVLSFGAWLAGVFNRPGPSSLERWRADQGKVHEAFTADVRAGVEQAVTAEASRRRMARRRQWAQSAGVAWLPLAPLTPLQPGATWLEAEAWAVRHMRFLGASAAYGTPPTRDGGIDVVGDRAVAQVKHHEEAVGSAHIRELVAVAARQGKTAVFYSTNGYSKPAVDLGEQAGVVMFRVGPDGLPVAATSHAAQVLRTGLS